MSDLDCITRKSGRPLPSTESNVIISGKPLHPYAFKVKHLSSQKSFQRTSFSQTSFSVKHLSQSNVFSVKRLFSQMSLQKQTYLVFSHSLYVPGRLHIFRVSNIILLFSLSILLQISLCPTIITTKSVFKRKAVKIMVLICRKLISHKGSYTLKGTEEYFL